MRILGIETSCDETAAAVVERGRVLSSVVRSQVDLFEEFGGIVPEISSRRHLELIHTIVKQALKRAGVSLEDIDVVAVTKKPGLIGSLLVGYSYAKALSYGLKKPLVGVDHLHAHIYSAELDGRFRFPLLGLVVSGGHTAAFLVRGLEFKVVARTRDDAAGEALDKIAKKLNLGYPGGPIIERMAKGGNPESFEFPVVKLKDGSLDFSYSGLKSQAARIIDREELKGKRLNDFLASFQKAIVDQLIDRLDSLVKIYNPAEIAITGGVSQNQHLRGRAMEFAKKRRLKLHLPEKWLCGDNAAMIAYLGEKMFKAGYTEDLYSSPFPRTEASKGEKQFQK